MKPYVLIVDDDENIRKLMTVQLNVTIKKSGLGEIDVLTASDGSEGIGITQKLGIKPVLVITDQEMPEVSGPEMIEIMRRTWDFTQLVIIMITGSIEIPPSQHNHLWKKPFRFKDIEPVIMNILEKELLKD